MISLSFFPVGSFFSCFLWITIISPGIFSCVDVVSFSFLYSSSQRFEPRLLLQSLSFFFNYTRIFLGLYHDVFFFFLSVAYCQVFFFSLFRMSFTMTYFCFLRSRVVYGFSINSFFSFCFPVAGFLFLSLCLH